MNLLTKFSDNNSDLYISDIKENAETLLAILKKVTSTEQGGTFMLKSVSSSNDEKVEPRITNNVQVGIYTVKVLKLASIQKNLSDGLYGKEYSLLDEGNYIFTLAYGEKTVDISVDVKNEDTNSILLEKLLYSIENRNAGIYGYIERYGKYIEKLVLKAKKTGESHSFKLFDKTGRIISYTGLWNIVREADNARFTFNDKVYESEENIVFMQEGNLILNLKEASREKIMISVNIDAFRIEEEIQSFVKKYNLFFKSLKKIKLSEEIETKMKNLCKVEKESLRDIGFKINSGYSIKINKNIFKKYLKDDYEKVKKVFVDKNDFLLELIKFCGEIIENELITMKSIVKVEEEKKVINSKAVYTNEGKVVSNEMDLGEKFDFRC
ncbi:flagellar filament capping protein FliD [Clostridium sp. ZS2-4]|uniref:flagellar filament capping protein FliD n=1 Tax=Clostridium sp. ZS2-4 TaxID=2987703 RepID=UPI00227D1830|nr:flagellar filament capping protein FliD [Clostridium sp. ZS2-4]MCY6356142.1 flagellar filament capping protein FliD [Clostridium sp. ZS2-4]